MLEFESIVLIINSPTLFFFQVKLFENLGFIGRHLMLAVGGLCQVVCSRDVPAGEGARDQAAARGENIPHLLPASPGGRCRPQV